MSEISVKKWLKAIGLMLIVLLGWLSVSQQWFSQKVSLQSKQSQALELEQLRLELAEHITERLKAERKQSELIDVSVKTPTLVDDKKAQAPYTLSYKEGEQDKLLTTTVEGRVSLTRLGEQWKIETVITSRENIVYSEPVLIFPGN